MQGMLNNYYLVFCHSKDSHNQKSTSHHSINSEAQHHEQNGLCIILYKRFGMYVNMVPISDDQVLG